MILWLDSLVHIEFMHKSDPFTSLAFRHLVHAFLFEENNNQSNPMNFFLLIKKICS